MTFTLFDKLSRFVSDYKISELIDAGGICGVLLLLDPIIHLLTARQRDLSQYAVVDGSAMVTILYACACFFFAIREFKKYPLCHQMLTGSSMFFFLLYCLYGLFTMLWSVDLKLTGYRAFECTAFMLVILVTITRLLSFNNFQLVIDWILLYGFFIALMRIITTLSWTTDLMTILGCNQMGCTLFFYLAFFRPHHKLVDYLIFALAIFSGSTVLYIGLTLGLVSTFRGSAKWKIIAVFLFLGLSMAAYIVGPEKLLKDTIFYDKAEISIEETSGRDHIMEAAFDCANQYPHGLGFFSAEPYWLYARKLAAINGHNSFFSAMMGCGYVGLVLIVLFIVAAFINVRSPYIDPAYRAPLFGSYCVAFVECLGNPSIGSRVYGAWMGEMFIFCLIAGFYCYGKCYHTNNFNTLHR